jgi:hypothetical protein
VKVFSEIVQLGIGVPVVCRAFGATEEKDPWLPTSLAAIASYALYRLVLVCAERISATAVKGYDKAVDRLQAQLKVAKQEGSARAALLNETRYVLWFCQGGIA